MIFSGARTIVLDADSDDDDPIRISVNSKQGLINNKNTNKQTTQQEKISEQDEFMNDSELSEDELPPHLSSKSSNSKRKQFSSNSNQKTSLAEADDLLNEINNDQYRVRDNHHRNNHDRFRQNGLNHQQRGKI